MSSSSLSLISVLCFRLSSSTEQSSSSQLMRRHKRRRRRHKVAKIDRVCTSKTHHCLHLNRCWHCRLETDERADWYRLCATFIYAVLFVTSFRLFSPHPSAVSQTPRWASTSSLSRSTWVNAILTILKTYYIIHIQFFLGRRVTLPCLSTEKYNFLGISIVGQSNDRGDGGIYIGSIMKGGAVAADGRIEPGDMLLQVHAHFLKMTLRLKKCIFVMIQVEYFFLLLTHEAIM